MNGERWTREETDREDTTATTDREATTATTDREDSAQREDPVAKEPRCDRVTKEVEEEHKNESQGGQETETAKDIRKNRKPRWRLRNQRRGDSSTPAHAKEN